MITVSEWSCWSWAVTLRRYLWVSMLKVCSPRISNSTQSNKGQTGADWSQWHAAAMRSNELSWAALTSRHSASGIPHRPPSQTSLYVHGPVHVAVSAHEQSGQKVIDHHPAPVWLVNIVQTESKWGLRWKKKCEQMSREGEKRGWRRKRRKIGREWERKIKDKY